MDEVLEVRGRLVAAAECAVSDLRGRVGGLGRSRGRRRAAAGRRGRAGLCSAGPAGPGRPRGLCARGRARRVCRSIRGALRLGPRC